MTFMYSFLFTKGSIYERVEQCWRLAE